MVGLRKLFRRLSNDLGRLFKNRGPFSEPARFEKSRCGTLIPTCLVEHQVRCHPRGCTRRRYGPNSRAILPVQEYLAELIAGSSARMMWRYGTPRAAHRDSRGQCVANTGSGAYDRLARRLQSSSTVVTPHPHSCISLQCLRFSK
jgi:hypothetical protein